MIASLGRYLLGRYIRKVIRHFIHCLLISSTTTKISAVTQVVRLHENENAIQATSTIVSLSKSRSVS